MLRRDACHNLSKRGAISALSSSLPFLFAQLKRCSLVDVKSPSDQLFEKHNSTSCEEISQIAVWCSLGDLVSKKALLQDDFFSSLCTGNNDSNYDKVYKATGDIYTFGRFTLFIYLEMLHVLTDLPIEPTILDLSEAESCRNGVVYAFNRRNLNTHGTDKKLTKQEILLLQNDFSEIMEMVQLLDIEHKSIWNVETTLCAYKKYRLGKRYVGFYIERAGKEIEKMQQAITEGVDWTPLWEFRKETYNHSLLKELW